MKEDRNDDFVCQWINTWNSHDIDEIMSHYSEDINFTSPMIQLIDPHIVGKLTNKADLRSYFLKGLQKYPLLHFELLCIKGLKFDSTHLQKYQQHDFCRVYGTKFRRESMQSKCAL